MSKLVLALLTDDDKMMKFEELDMSWVEQFNKEFQQQAKVPFNEEIYKEELVEMTSFAVLNSMVLTENDEEFRVNREPLKEKIKRLFGYEQQQETQVSPTQL